MSILALIEGKKPEELGTIAKMRILFVKSVNAFEAEISPVI